MVNIYKFCKKDFLIQPPGEPREQHLGDVWNKKLEQHKIVKDRTTGRVNIRWRIFEKIKIVKNEVAGMEKRRFWFIYLKSFKKFTFLGPVTSILIYLQFSQTCFRLYRPFR